MERKVVDENGLIKLKMVVACTNANGDADLFFFIMDKIPEDQYDLGGHFDAAKEHAENEGYEHPMVVFDDSMPIALENIFEWETASVISHC
jgi:hypothetical protein